MLSVRADEPTSDQEWRDFLSSQDFGQLIAPGIDRELPVVVPSHYIFDGQNMIELHLHRENPVWDALEENPSVIFSTLDASVYLPSTWNAPPGTAKEWAAPTSYYAAVQAQVRATIVDDPPSVADLLRRQMAHFQPEGGYATIEPGTTRFGRMIPGVRGVRLEVVGVVAKFKFGGNRTAGHRLDIAEKLLERNGPGDRAARTRLLRRLEDSEGRTGA